MGTTKACSLSRIPWFPKRKAILQGQRVKRSRMDLCKLVIKSFTRLLPITVFVAPRSKTPKLPCVAKQVSDKGIDGVWDGVSTWHSGAASILGETQWRCMAKPGFPLCLNWRVSLNFPKGSLTKLWLHKTNSKRGSSMIPSCDGRSRNSKGSWSTTSVWWTAAWTNAVGAIEPGGRLGAPPSCGPGLMGFWGHSAFQWPTRLQMRHLDSRIRCCRVFLDPLFWNLPFTPFDDENLPPFEDPLLCTGQKPLCLAFSARRLLASVYAFNDAASSSLLCIHSVAAVSKSATNAASSSPSERNVSTTSLSDSWSSAVSIVRVGCPSSTSEPSAMRTAWS